MIEPDRDTGGPGLAMTARKCLGISIESNDVHRREPALDRYGEGARAAADIEYPVIRLHGGLLK
jgi:hypothetical protein